MLDCSEGWRFGVKLRVPAKVLRGYVNHHGFTVRTLAAEVTRVSKEPCSKASVGHLLSGERKGIGDTKAKAIEKILDVPAGTFFVPTVSRVARDARGRRIA